VGAPTEVALIVPYAPQVVVLEGHEDFEREFRGEVLQPSTARLLDQIGLLEYVKAQPHILLDRGRLLIHGKPAGGFDFRTIAPAYPYAIWMPQPIFLEALARKAQPTAGRGPRSSKSPASATRRRSCMTIKSG
jgi:2-polyprenyl-6-methoxyphenol hydroxylase-like FAD-dependent oxidoreductase